MATSAADVPGRFDLVISGGSLANPVGFVFLDALEPSLPFRTHRAIYSYTPTFIERSNVSGNFGDNQQDFFLTSSQRDWSEGEQQRFFRASDQDSVRRYWQGTNVNVTDVVGQVSLRPLTAQTSAFGAAITEMVGGFGFTSDTIYATSTTNLYSITSAGTITDAGAHGLGAAPSAMVIAGGYPLLLSTFATGSVGVRSWNGVVTFATFSATGANSLAYLNNTLFGLTRDSASSFNSRLIRYDTSGVATVLFTWKTATGTEPGFTGRLVPFGGKLLILRSGTGSGAQAELWIYDGSGVSMLSTFGPGFTGLDLEVVQGTAFISGYFTKTLSSSTYRKPAIFFYANGTIGKLWEANTWVVSTAAREPRLKAFGQGLAFTDDTVGSFMFYNPSTGGVSAIGSYTTTDQTPRLEACDLFLLHTRAATQPYRHPADGFATSGTVTTSLFDFDSSLTKLFRGIKVDYDAATDGNGGSVDISYQVDSVDGAYTSLQTSAASGTEYTFSASGHTLSVKITLNKGTSTSGPVLKRISVRAAPILTSFRMGEYVIDCTGDGGKSPRTLRDGTPNPLAGSESMAQLEIAKASTSPLTITDRRGSYTGYIETLEGYEEHPGIDDPTRSGEFVTKMITRGV